MSAVSWDIEQIVREVLAALQGQQSSGVTVGQPGQPVQSSPRPTVGSVQQPPVVSTSGQAAASPSMANHSMPKPQTLSEDGQLRITSRLVTMADLRACGLPENLEGLRRLVVRPDALITPLVRDELQRRNILLVADGSLAGEDVAGGPDPVVSAAGSQSVSADQLTEPQSSKTSSEAAAGASGRTGSRGRLLMVVHGRAYEPAGLVRRLTEQAVPLEVRQMDCILRAIDALAEAIRAGNYLGVLLTGYVAIGLCAANRQVGVRAVWGMEPGQAASDTASLGANLLVINPRQVSPYQLEKMIRQFYRAGIRTCPEPLKSRLA
ncbi:MAG: hypothetical protein RMI90_10015 [Thermoguttaceae bacterium]|nr:hypothetical protein [Thermoguttaceae bacterium]